ncbi:MAG: SecD/SecF fusion protein [Frankiaceae bacterium]|nr:SecD/SecF fusion protein [Frankiaceae bacterium]
MPARPYSAPRSAHGPRSPRRSRAGLVRALLALAAVAASIYVLFTTPAQLGLDLRGGTLITLETRDTATRQADADATERTLEVLRRRVDALGVAEPTLARSGSNRILVELPGVQDPRRAAEVIGRTAQLTFHAVTGIGAIGTETPTTGLDQTRRSPFTLPDESGQPLQLAPSDLTGEAVSGAQTTSQEFGTGWLVNIDFSGPGGAGWERLTANGACAPPGDPARRVAIVLDGKVISSPQVNSDVACNVGIVGGRTSITGSFTQAEADELALLVRAGALPVPVETIEQRTVGATLGEEAISASLQAAIIGGLLTIAFILVIYRLAGLLASVALVLYGGMSYAVLAALGATLTLPGIAGFVLAIGMAVDANVLVFERAREEVAEGVPMRRAVRTGFSKAFSAIADSNVTTLLAAGLLFFLAAGPVRGFGVTLSVGVLVSMFTALVVTRVMLETAVASGFVQRRPWLTGLSTLGRVRTWLTARNPDLMRGRRLWLAVSAVAVVVSMAGVATRGLDYGVEFTGGRLVEYTTTSPVPVDVARTAVADAGLPRAVVQTSGDNQITVRGSELTNDAVQNLRAELGELGGGATLERDELIGPSLGDELRQKALLALGVALLAQLAYLAFRFRWTFAASAVAAMAHDVAILLGAFAWLGKPVDGVFLAALLTVIGYSVNDSVVVFDRIREQWGQVGRESTGRGAGFAAVANDAVLQTVPRTVNTGLGAIFILAALALLGGDSLTDFAIALLVGIIVGTYSSMLTATPLAVVLENRWPATPPAPKADPTLPSARPARPAARRERADSGAVV